MMKRIKSHGGLFVAVGLTVVLAVLKVAKVIAWSWLWVIAPLWIPLSIDVIATTIYVMHHVYKMKKEHGEEQTCKKIDIKEMAGK